MWPASTGDMQNFTVQLVPQTEYVLSKALIPAHCCVRGGGHADNGKSLLGLLMLLVGSWGLVTIE